MPEERLGDFYASLDVFTLPSVNAFEAFGIVQAVAMLAGVPVLSSDIPGVRQPVEHGFAVLREGSDGLWNVPYGRVPWPGDAVRAAPAFAQYVAGRLVLAPGTGESAVFVVERR